MSRMPTHVGGSFADDAGRILATAERVQAGGAAAPETYIRFWDWETLFRLLTPTRIAVLRHVYSHDVPGVRALPRVNGRDYRRVHDDSTIVLELWRFKSWPSLAV